MQCKRLQNRNETHWPWSPSGWFIESIKQVATFTQLGQLDFLGNYLCWKINSDKTTTSMTITIRCIVHGSLPLQMIFVGNERQDPHICDDLSKFPNFLTNLLSGLFTIDSAMFCLQKSLIIQSHKRIFQIYQVLSKKSNQSRYARLLTNCWMLSFETWSMKKRSERGNPSIMPAST